MSQGQVPLLPLAREKSRSPINQLSNGNNGATPSTSSGIEQGPLHKAGARGDRICLVFPGPPRSPDRWLSLGPRGRQRPQQGARWRPPPSPGFPPCIQRGERRPQPGWSYSTRPPPPDSKRPLAPLLRSHHGDHSGSGARLPGPAAPAQGRPAGQRSREPQKSACAGHARCSIDARGVGGDLRSVGGAVGGACLSLRRWGNLLRLRTPDTVGPVTTLGC